MSIHTITNKGSNTTRIRDINHHNLGISQIATRIVGKCYAGIITQHRNLGKVLNHIVVGLLVIVGIEYRCTIRINLCLDTFGKDNLSKECLLLASG